MGLASFNRMRRERAGVNLAEAERFERNNQARWERKRAQDDEQRATRGPLQEISALEAEANARIGDKVAYAAAHPDRPDPLKLDHAAEVAAQDVHGAQETRSPVERARERLAAPEHEARVEAAESVVTEGEAFSPEAEAAKSEPRASQETLPDGWRSYKAEELKELAANLGLGEFDTGKDARAALEAEEERRQKDAAD